MINGILIVFSLVSLLFSVPLSANTSIPQAVKAIKSDDIAQVSLLIEQGLDVNAIASEKSGESLLHLAVAKKRVAIVEQLLVAGADVDVTDNKGFTPLIRAAGKNIEILKLLLDRDASVNLATNTGVTALLTALGSGDGGIERAVLLENADATFNVSRFVEIYCDSCHGDNIKLSLKTRSPVLDGQNANYLSRQLLAVQQGERIASNMDRPVSALSRQSMELIGKHYSEKPVKSVEADYDLDRFAKGKDIYHSSVTNNGNPTCASCHGEKGNGNTGAGIPKLANQPIVYTLEQFENFSNDKRNNIESSAMTTISKSLTPDEMKSLAHYLRGMASD